MPSEQTAAPPKATGHLGSPHDYGKAKARSEQAKGQVPDEEPEDPLEKMLKLTGCAEHHYSLQDCMFEQRDWRKCQPLVKVFKNCMTEYEKRKMTQSNKSD